MKELMFYYIFKDFVFPKISKGGMGGKVLQPTQHPLKPPFNFVRYLLSVCVHDMTKTTAWYIYLQNYSLHYA